MGTKKNQQNKRNQKSSNKGFADFDDGYDQSSDNVFDLTKRPGRKPDKDKVRVQPLKNPKVTTQVQEGCEMFD